MTEVGESAGGGAPPSSSDEDLSVDHDELELEVTDILDAMGTSIMAGAADYDPRQNAVVGDTQTLIKFETKHQETIIFLVIQPAPSSTVANDYYNGRSIVLFAEMLEPGSHEFEWDGRSRWGRLVIEGDYDVILDAYCPRCAAHVEARTTIHVRKPWAHCYGGVYGGQGQLVGSNLHGNYTGRADTANAALASLSDGSGFDSAAHHSSSGAAALVKLHEEAAVWFWGGHGGPGIISLPRGGTMTAIVSEMAVAPTYAGIVTAGNCASVRGLPQNALADVFLVVLCGCQTSATPANARSLPVQLVRRGADMVVGFDLSIFTASANKWTRDFFRYLGRSMGVEDAVRRANQRAATPAFRQRLNSYRIVVGRGVNRNVRLNPARYGLK